MMRHFTLLCLAAAAIGGGCQTQKKVEPSIPRRAPDAETRAVIPNLDPGAMRLQDISGALLMYYATHQKLPEKLEELKPLGTEEPLNFISPATNKPYIYTPDGIILQDRQQRIIVYDPMPGANGYRQVITMDEPVPNQPLVTKVIALRESFFLLRPPK